MKFHNFEVITGSIIIPPLLNILHFPYSQESVSSNQALMPNDTCIKEEIEPAEESSNQNDNQFHEEENFRENDNQFHEEEENFRENDDFTKKNNASTSNNENNENNFELADSGSNEMVANITDSGIIISISQKKKSISLMPSSFTR